MRDAELGPALVTLWKHNYSVYGRRKLHKAAQRAGIDAGRDQVGRLMAPAGIRGASRAKRPITGTNRYRLSPSSGVSTNPRPVQWWLPTASKIPSELHLCGRAAGI